MSSLLNNSLFLSLAASAVMKNHRTVSPRGNLLHATAVHRGLRVL